jgi:membrane-associated phospholipid phosphatase
MSKPAAPLPPLTTPPDAWRIGGSLLAMVLAVATVLLVDAKTEFEVVEKSLLWAGNKLELDDVFYATESLGEYPALIVIFWAIIALAPRRRAYLGSLLVALLVAGAVSFVVKEATGRARPDYSVIIIEQRQSKKRLEMMEIAKQYPQIGIKLDKDGGMDNQGVWLLWNRPLKFIGKTGFASFPSGHANQAFILAVFMTAFFRGRGKVLWYILAVFCALSRVRYERHFPSDVLMGSAMGFLLTHWVLSWEWPQRFGARLFRATDTD